MEDTLGIIPQPMDAEEEQKEQLVSDAGSFAIPIEDDDLVRLINGKTAEADRHIKKLKLVERRKINEEFWRGDQINEGDLEDHELAYVDNIIFQDTETRISIASGRVPDILTGTTSESLKSRENARKVQKVLNTKLKNDEIRRLVKHGLRHNHLYFQGAVKAFWDKNRGEHGDFGFKIVHPYRMLVDPTAVIPETGFTADEMEFIIEWCDEPLAVVLKKFPGKRNEILGQAKKNGQNPTDLASKIRYQEVWFSFYGRDGKLIEGVSWKYQNIILDKMKNPYYDWEGATRVLDVPTVNEMGEQTAIEPFYRNHFERPRKPYIFFSHVTLGNGPIDATSPVEQSIPLQKAVNRRGMQITEIADYAVPRLIFSGRYIEKSEVTRLSSDPKEYIWLKTAEKVGDAVTQIVGQPPNPILFQDLIGNRGQIDSKFATHGTTRGEVRAESSGVSKQVTREGDLTMADDISATVVDRVVREMANWATQLMKLNYKKAHYVRELGKEGEIIDVEMQRDMIEDGLIVTVDASSTDKQTRRSDALQMANAQIIDPFTLYEEMGVDNPKERARRLLAFKRGELDQFQSYEASLELTDTDGTQTAEKDIQTITVTGQIPTPKRVDEEYLQTFFRFVNSPAFDQQPPEMKQAVQSYIAGLRDVASRINLGAPQQGGQNATAVY
ncbi:MAG: hypothetical protein QME66_04210 [Candidatus Eisenbacteria bacterium]|nr:hypothetical protein [Candidatus Eisenbacteria bacterium]